MSLLSSKPSVRWTRAREGVVLGFGTDGHMYRIERSVKGGFALLRLALEGDAEQLHVAPTIRQAAEFAGRVR